MLSVLLALTAFTKTIKYNLFEDVNCIILSKEGNIWVTTFAMRLIVFVCHYVLLYITLRYVKETAHAGHAACSSLHVVSY